MAGVIVLLLCSFASAATYNIGPGKPYTNIGDAPWSSLNAGDVVNIYPQTAITGTTASASTGTTITLTDSAGSIPYGSTVWFSGYTGIMPWVTCGEYGSGLYSTAKSGTACSGNDVTISSAVNIGSGVTVYFTPPYFEKIYLVSTGTSSQPIIVQGVADPTTGALPVLDAHNATTGPNMAHYGTAQFHDRLGLVVFGRNTAQTGWTEYVTLRRLRLQGARNGLTMYDVDNASAVYAVGVAGIRFENAFHVTIAENQIVNNENGIFGATNGETSCNYCLFLGDLLLSGNHLWQNGDGSGCHQSYIESNGIVYEQNWYDVPGCTGCSQLKDRSSGMVVRYNLFYPSSRVFDFVAAQNGKAVIVPQVELTVPAGGFASGATSLTFSSSVAGIAVGDRVGYVHNTAGWGYPGSGKPVMPTVSAVDTGTNTLTLDAPGIPGDVAAGEKLNVIQQAPNAYRQSFVYGNVIDWDQNLRPLAPGSIVHYGWDTAGGIDSVYDRAGTLYFYHNTVITRWDKSGSTGSSYGNNLFQTESEADTIRADNNLFYVTKANDANPSTYLQVMAKAGYGAGFATPTQFGGGKNLVVTAVGTGASTCGGYTLTGWAACSYAPTSGSSIDLSNWTAITATQAFPSGLTGRDYRLQAGSSAINAATALPAAITSNTLGMDLTPTSQYGGTARTNLVDVGAYQYTEGTPDPPATIGASFSGGAAIGGGVVVQ